MSTQPDEDLFVDGAVFNDNANRFPREELLRYAGRHVAWSRDGTRILASGRDEDDLDVALKAAGLGLKDVVLDFIPPDDMDPIIL